MEEVKKNTFRSTPYPATHLESSIADLERVRKNLGKGTYSRPAITQALGYRGLSGAAVRKAAALVHYGLLERTGNAYMYSPLSDRILYPLNEDDKAQAIADAALNPKLYSSLVERFSGLAIPSMLENILIQQYRISDQVSKSAANDFTKTMEYAGLLRNGILYESIEIKSTDSKKDDFEEEEQDDAGETSSDHLKKGQVKPGYTQLPALPSGIIVQFPDDLASYASLGRFSDGLNLLEDKAKELRST